MTISPPRPKGPPLNALRAFETAARHGSFSSAADELSVTPGAIAQHIKVLENWVGARLFTRKAHGVQLTALGSSVLPRFNTAFDQLGEAVQSLRSLARPDQIRIAALPSVAQLWLSPRLPGIRAAHPDLNISVIASEYPPNLKREQFDLSLFYEDAPVDDEHMVVCQDIILPVCAPQLAKHISQVEDLNDVTCLHDASWSDDWNLWLQASEQAMDIRTDGPSYSLYSLMLEEARNGAGIMIGHRSLVQASLDCGDLVAPFKKEVKLDRYLAAATQLNDDSELLQQIIAYLTHPEQSPAIPRK